MTAWFVQREDSEEGPLSPSDLLKLVREGRVTAESMLRKDDSAWFQADQVGGLFEAAVRPSVQYFCPACEARIRQPPSVCNQCGSEVIHAKRSVTEHSISDGRPEHTDKAKQSMQRWLSKVRKK